MSNSVVAREQFEISESGITHRPTAHHPSEGRGKLERRAAQGRSAGRAGFQGASIDALHRTWDRLTFTAGLSINIVRYNCGGPIRRSIFLSRRQVVDANVRIHVQEVRAVHTAASDGGMRTAVRVPGMRRACAPCPPNRTKLPYRVG
jgi:hypothetical protein